jgi:phosphoglycolate phosphatase-like HAD superfamily hydrolase
VLLLLFDIDGTLVSGATDAHRDAMHAALKLVHGIDAWTQERPLLSPAGRTDPEIARTILLGAGVSADQIDERADAVQEACCREYARLCPGDLSMYVLPGVSELLTWLSSTDAKLGLLTGNYEPVARLKLARAGVGAYFAGGPGGFGSDDEDRAGLPAIARRRAGSVGRPHPRGQTVVIGDTPRDIACARADGVRCVAIATGPYGSEDLTGADSVAGDANELRELLAGELERGR